MKKEIKRDKIEHYKISATIFTDEELERLEHKIEIDLDEIVNQVTEAVLTNREHILLQKVIEKQQKEIERLKNLNKATYIRKDTIRHIRDKAECMDYYSLSDVIDDLTKLIGDHKYE